MATVDTPKNWCIMAPYFLPPSWELRHLLSLPCIPKPQNPLQEILKQKLQFFQEKLWDNVSK